MQRHAAGKIIAALTTVTAVGRGEGCQADADVVAKTLGGSLTAHIEWLPAE